MAELATGTVREFKDRETKKQVVDPVRGRKWQIVINLPSCLDTTQKQPRKYYTFYGSLRKANEEMNRLVFELNEQIKQNIVTTEVVRQENKDITFGEYAMQWITARESSMPRNTWESYERMLKVHIIPMLGHIKLSKIGPAHVAEYRDKKLVNGRADGKPGGLDKDTVNKHLAVISGVLDSAASVEIGLIPYNYTMVVKRAKGRTSQKTKAVNKGNAVAINCYWQADLNILLNKLEKLYSYRRLPRKNKTEEVIETLMDLGFTYEETLSDSALFKFKTAKLYPIVYLDSRTGMRISEILALGWDNIDFNKKIIVVTSSVHYGRKKEGEEHGFFFNNITKEGKVKSHITIM
jgi:integrase